jgi:hypothetical protein
MVKKVDGGSPVQRPQPAPTPAIAPEPKAEVPSQGWAPKTAGTDSKGSTIWRKLARWDSNHDGKLSERESANLFQSVGLPKAWAQVSAVTTGVARGPLGHALKDAAAGDLSGVLKDAKDFARGPLSVDLDHIGDSRLEAQTGVFDAKANADPAKVKAFIDGVTDAQGHATLESLEAHCQKDAARSMGEVTGPLAAGERKYRFGEAYSAWVQLMEVAGHQEPGKAPYLTREQLQSVYDGTMFDQILSQPKKNDISVLHILRELLAATLKA